MDRVTYKAVESMKDITYIKPKNNDGYSNITPMKGALNHQSII